MTDQAASLCPYCQSATQPDAYFCSQCGKAVRSKPLSVTLMRKLAVYSVSLFLPPFGLWYAWKYLRQEGSTAKRIGIAAILLTIIATALTVWSTVALLNTINQAVNDFGGLNSLSL